MLFWIFMFGLLFVIMFCVSVNGEVWVRVIVSLVCILVVGCFSSLVGVVVIVRWKLFYCMCIGLFFWCLRCFWVCGFCINIWLRNSISWFCNLLII